MADLWRGMFDDETIKERYRSTSAMIWQLRRGSGVYYTTGFGGSSDKNIALSLSLISVLGP